MFVRRPSRMALLLAAGLTIALPSMAIAAPPETPGPAPTASAPRAAGQHLIEVVQPADPFDLAILQGTKPEGEKATVTTAWGYRYDVPAAGTTVRVPVPCPPAGWVAGRAATVTYTPEGGAAATYEIRLVTGGTPAPGVPGDTTHRIGVVNPVEPFDSATLRGTKPEGKKATVTTPWGDRYDVKAAGTDVIVTVSSPPAGWVAGNTYKVTYLPEGGQAFTIDVLFRSDTSRDNASVDQPDSRFDTAWVILPSAEKGPFTIKTDYGFHQKYGEAPYGVIPPPAGGWEPGKSYRVEVRYASGRSGVVQVKLPVNADDPGIRGTLSGPDAKGTLTVQLNGVPVGEEVRVALYAGTIVSEVTADGGRAASTSPSYRLTPGGGWKKGQTYIVVATVGSQQPMGDHRWVQSFTYDGPAKPGTSTPKPTPPKDRKGGLAKTGF